MTPPPPTPAAISASVSEDDTGVQLRAGLGVGRYTEKAPGVLFEANLEPQAQARLDGVWPVGNAQLVVFAAASFGTQVAMAATSNGSVVQQNQFRMELYEASPRMRWPINPHVAIELGYRFTYQRLFFIDVPIGGQNETAEEDVTVHAGELGVLWHRATTDGGRATIDAGFGFNHGGAKNSLIQGGDFSASGHSLWLHGEKRWPSGMTLGGAWTTRTQDGSTSQNVTVMGMQTTAVWPQNTTWALLLLAGYTI